MPKQVKKPEPSPLELIRKDKEWDSDMIGVFFIAVVSIAGIGLAIWGSTTISQGEKDCRTNYVKNSVEENYRSKGKDFTDDDYVYERDLAIHFCKGQN